MSHHLPPSPGTRRTGPPVRTWVAVALLAVLASLTAACSGSSNAATPALPLDKPLPTSVPKDTTIVVGDPATQVAL